MSPVGRKYLLVLVLTALIFATVFFLSSNISQRKFQEIQTIQDRVAVDILSLETQFDLLRSASCKVAKPQALTPELGNLADKLAYAETELRSNQAEINYLKKYYSLLEIKDFLLADKISKECRLAIKTVLYFYATDAKDCADCRGQGHVLTALRERYPELRVYSFDYHLDSSVVKTLISIYDIKPELPALVIDEEVIYGQQNISTLEKLLRLATTTATGTPAKI